MERKIIMRATMTMADLTKVIGSEMRVFGNGGIMKDLYQARNYLSSTGEKTVEVELHIPDWDFRSWHRLRGYGFISREDIYLN